VKALELEKVGLDEGRPVDELPAGDCCEATKNIDKAILDVEKPIDVCGVDETCEVPVPPPSL